MAAGISENFLLDIGKKTDSRCLCYSTDYVTSEVFCDGFSFRET